MTTLSRADSDEVRSPVPPRRLGLEELIVMAERRETSPQDVPISMTALPGTVLREAGMTNTMEVARLAPNVSMAIGQGGSGAAHSGQAFIRGVGQLDYLFTSDPGVGIYVDGVYYPRAVGAVMDLLDLEQVEILRGPQGTLYGKDTIGGAINLIAAKPQPQPAAYAEISVGRFDRADFRGMVNLPTETNALLARIAGSATNRDGYASTLDFDTGVQTGEAGDEHRRALRGTLRWFASDATTLDLVVDGAHENQHSVPTRLLQFDDIGAFGGVPAILWNALIGSPAGRPMSSSFITKDPDTSYATGPNRNTLDHYGVAVTLSTAVRSLALKSLTAYREFEATFGRDGDGAPLTYVETENEQRSRVVSQEVQLFGAWGPRGAEWLAGAFYFREFGRDLNDVRLASGLYSALENLPAQFDGNACAPPFTNPGCHGNPYNQFFDLDLDIFNEIHVDSAALYGHTRVPVGRRLQVVAGARYTRDAKSYTLSIERLTAQVFSVPRTTFRESWTAVTPMAAVELRWSPDRRVYLSAARGFKSGGFNGRVNTSAGEARPFNPEFLWSYELGLKSEWLGRRLRVNAAVFTGDYDDLQFTATSFDPDTGSFIVIVDNVASAEIKGFEIEVQARLLTNLEIGLGIGRTAFELTALDSAAIGITPDTRHPRTPEWTSALTVKHEWSLADRKRLSLSANWSHESESFADIANTPSLAQRAHALVSARLAIEAPATGWELAIVGTNLTDERFIVNGVQALNSFGTAEGFANRPREWALSVRKHFF
jgi:iron complex outermembrane receptor protein